MRDSAGRSTIALRALAAAGLDPSTFTLRPLAANWLAATWAARSPELDAILKVHPCDLRARLTADPDSRFRTFAATFPLSPFFQPAARPLDAARAVLGDLVPRVLAEGALDDAAHYTLMTRVPGQRREVNRRDRPAAVATLSRRMGELLRRMHAAPLASELATAWPADRWIERCAEILHCLADHLGAFALHRTRRRHDYHLRFHRLIERLRHRPLGPTVLAHNDFHPENLLFDDRLEITGIVDFELACCGPAALDFRRLSTLDETAFAAGYGIEEGDLDRACWLGHFFDMMWQALALVAWQRFSGVRIGGNGWLRSSAHFEYLLGLCENDHVRRGPVRGRRLASALAHTRAAVRTLVRRHRHAAVENHMGAKVAIIVVTRNHFETTTRLCLESVRWFTDVPYQLICVDNDSVDGTRAALRAAARDDPRVAAVFVEENLGWADGSLLGLRQVDDDATHVVLLNSDTIVSPGWLAKLLWHMGKQRPSTVLIPREDIQATARSYPPIEPGAGPAPPPPPALTRVLQVAAAIDRSDRLRSRAAAPSGFCLLFRVTDRSVIEGYLGDFARYHSGELDWYAWWSGQQMQCRLALDCYVFHSRGGSGGYYAYDHELRGDAS